MTEPTTTTTTKKTVYLIRHAESEENVRMKSLTQVWSSVTRFSLPRSSDLQSSVQLLNVQAQVDSSVSAYGRAQIENVAQQLQAADFLQTAGVTLVAHSPLVRAQETSQGLLQCRVSSSSSPDCSNDASIMNCNPLPDKIRVVSLDVLREKTPAEWLPGNSASLRKRLNDLETWLSQQDETVICLVGHSQYFKNLLNLSYKFRNCDVYKLQFDPAVARQVPSEKNVFPPQWSGLERVFECTVTGDASLSADTETAAACTTTEAESSNLTPGTITQDGK